MRLEPTGPAEGRTSWGRPVAYNKWFFLDTVFRAVDESDNIRFLKLTMASKSPIIVGFEAVFYEAPSSDACAPLSDLGNRRM